MADQSRADIIRDHPIGKGLDSFRDSFHQICTDRTISPTADAFGQLHQEDLLNLALPLLISLQSLPAAGQLRPEKGHGSLRTNLLRLIASVASDDFNLDHIKPLFKSAIADDLDDTNIWDQADHTVTEVTPQPPASFLEQQTPWLRTTGGLTNTLENRSDIDPILKSELGPLFVGVRCLREKFFRRVAGLEAASETVFKKCVEGNDPLFGRQGWSDWPASAGEKDVLEWIGDVIPKLETFAQNCGFAPTTSRQKLFAQPKIRLLGKRSLAIGFVDNKPRTEKGFRYRWSDVLVPGELKSNPSADVASNAWVDLAKYAREVFSAQDTRRFVLGFTLCGSFMRIWVFDRLGGIASEAFDINVDGPLFISTILGFLWMDEEGLGFDPTVMTEGGERYIEIERDGLRERLILDELMQRTRCINGRATTCWKAHRQGQPQTPLVIKDSWQYPERDEEGEMLREATSRDVINVARYYYHETVQVHGKDDDIRNNIRGEIDVTTGTKYWPARPMQPLPRNAIAPGASRGGRSNKDMDNIAAGKKRSFSQIGASLPPGKRSSSSTSPTKAVGDELLTRVHRRVILRDYGKPIYKASSRSALLAAFEGCVEGHESLRKAGFLHRDISINNLMINEDINNYSWSSFLIDLDVAIKEDRIGATGANGKTGTRAFMAIGVLMGEQHSFMHDLESFFWVLFWLCIHYDAQGKDVGLTEFESWNYENADGLADRKKGMINDEEDFLKNAERHFTLHYQPLIPWVNRLRRKVFPNGRRWKRPEPALYSSIKEILREARIDPAVLAD